MPLNRSRGRGDEFERAYHCTGTARPRSPHFLSFEVTRCVSEPTSYIVRLGRDSIPDHLEGFQRSEQFRGSSAHIRPCVDDIREMRHYEEATGTRATA